ncbi:MAG: hypothetical protein ACREXT_02315, partial [Gammaproteobacteria bacterium]
LNRREQPHRKPGAAAGGDYPKSRILQRACADPVGGKQHGSGDGRLDAVKDTSETLPAQAFSKRREPDPIQCRAGRSSC